MDNTVIRRGVKLDNLIQIAHNCEVGEHTCDGFAGWLGWLLGSGKVVSLWRTGRYRVDTLLSVIA